MIIDTFLYNGERKVLELRLQYLAPVVDKFIIVESNTTHSGKSKPLYFLEHSIKFSSDILNKLQYHVVSFPSEFTPWERENQQRNYIQDFIRDYPSSSYVMMSDLDEIPKRQFIIDQHEGVFVMPCFWYYVNWFNKSGKWFGTVGMSVDKFLKKTPQEWRDVRHGLAQKEDMGWHFSYMGGQAEVYRKLDSFAHVEFNPPYPHDKPIVNINPENFEVWKLDSRFPDELIKNQEQYKELIWEKCGCIKG